MNWTTKQPIIVFIPITNCNQKVNNLNNTHHNYNNYEINSVIKFTSHQNRLKILLKQINMYVHTYEHIYVCMHSCTYLCIMYI